MILMACTLCIIIGSASGQDDQRKRDRERAINTKRETPVKVIEFIVGTWEIQSVYKNQKNITNADTLVSFTRIRFNRENQYRAFHDEQDVDSGTFRLNETHSVLYLESADGGEPQSWNVSFHGNTMILQPAETANAFDRSFRYVYVRRE